MVDGLVKKYAGRYDIRVMDTSNDSEAVRLAESYGVQGVPTFVFLNTDGSQSGTVIGKVPGEELEAALAKTR